MTFTFYSGLDSIKVNQRARYPGQSSKVIVRGHTRTHRHIRLAALPRPVKWQVKHGRRRKEASADEKVVKPPGERAYYAVRRGGVAAWIHDSAETTTAKRLAFADSRNAVTAARGRANEPTPAPRVRASVCTEEEWPVLYILHLGNRQFSLPSVSSSQPRREPS